MSQDINPVAAAVDSLLASNPDLAQDFREKLQKMRVRAIERETENKAHVSRFLEEQREMYEAMDRRMDEVRNRSQEQLRENNEFQQLWMDENQKQAGLLSRIAAKLTETE